MLYTKYGLHSYFSSLAKKKKKKKGKFKTMQKIKYQTYSMHWFNKWINNANNNVLKQCDEMLTENACEIKRFI